MASITLIVAKMVKLARMSVADPRRARKRASLRYLSYSRKKMPKYGFGGRTAIPLDDYKDEILRRLYTGRETQGQVIQWLKDHKSIQINPRTLRRRLQAWVLLE